MYHRDEDQKSAQTWLETITPSTIIPIQQSHKLRRRIAMIVRWTEGLACDVPAWAEDKEVRKWDARLLRFSGENTEDGGVDMVLRNAANVDEFFQGIFVRDIACEDISRLVQQRVSLMDTHFPCHATTSKGVCSCAHS